MITVILSALAAFLLGELLALVVFSRIRASYAPHLQATGKAGVSIRAVLKGILERSMLFLGLIMDYAVILAAFGAFKLGTRLKDDQEQAISNDYFLVGNLSSILIVLLQVLSFRGLTHVLA